MISISDSRQWDGTQLEGFFFFLLVFTAFVFFLENPGCSPHADLRTGTRTNRTVGLIFSTFYNLVKFSKSRVITSRLSSNMGTGKPNCRTDILYLLQFSKIFGNPG
ncbi:hypothetical protein CEXT_551411 [Caerostris extrusa]|uniref:Uncharacterized protein n=1 Tax=Caerostris extrusa TaxID=172846 RepID=A0AAV4UPV9_CAEEX|nr:hypothetical protein CEXT_551411 [Caerostris extrusa]